MPRRVQIDTGRALAQIGVVGAATQFELGDGPLVPTIQIADLSSSMAGDYVEPRGTVGAGLIGTAGSPCVELICAAEGGLLVEDVQLSAGNLGGSFPFIEVVEGAWVVDIRGANFEPRRTGPLGRADKGNRIPLLAGFRGLNVLDVGSIPTRSFANSGERDGVGFYVGPASAWMPPQFTFHPGTRWYVPAGGQLFILMNSVFGPNGAATATVCFTYRELLGRGAREAGHNT